MTSLLDIGPLTEEVAVRGHKIAVQGVSALGAVSLLSRFPEVRMLMGGRAADLTADMIVALAPKIVAAIIAAGTGKPGDVVVETAASNLGLEEQLDLITAILRLTFPQGVGPFVDRLMALAPGEGAVADAAGWAAGTKLPAQSSG